MSCPDFLPSDSCTRHCRVDSLAEMVNSINKNPLSVPSMFFLISLSMETQKKGFFFWSRSTSFYDGSHSYYTCIYMELFLVSFLSISTYIKISCKPYSLNRNHRKNQARLPVFLINWLGRGEQCYIYHFVCRYLL